MRSSVVTFAQPAPMTELAVRLTPSFQSDRLWTTRLYLLGVRLWILLTGTNTHSAAVWSVSWHFEQFFCLCLSLIARKVVAYRELLNFAHSSDSAETACCQKAISYSRQPWPLHRQASQIIIVWYTHNWSTFEGNLLPKTSAHTPNTVPS